MKDNLNESHDPQHTKNHNISRTTTLIQFKRKNYYLPSLANANKNIFFQNFLETQKIKNHPKRKNKKRK